MEQLEFRNYDGLDKECKMTISQFRGGVKYNCFTQYDGFGLYATHDKVSNKEIKFSELFDNTLPEWATHVCWYNK